MLAPVAHPQHVFTLLKRLRPIFSRHRAWQGELWCIAARLLTGAYAAAAPGARPGPVLFVQNFGNLANFNPHLHVLAADGVFGAEGTFTALPPVPDSPLAGGFRRGFLAFLVEERGDRGRAAREDARLGLLPRVRCAQPGARWESGWRKSLRRCRTSLVTTSKSAKLFFWKCSKRLASSKNVMSSGIARCSLGTVL